MPTTKNRPLSLAVVDGSGNIGHVRLTEWCLGCGDGTIHPLDLCNGGGTRLTHSGYALIELVRQFPAPKE